MSLAPSRERRSWTAKEDQLLRDAVEREDPHNPNPSKWHAIAKHVPNRTNKDCRKRWFAKMASDVVKGGWSPEEDERLVQGIKLFGTRWSQVASIVQSRNSDQCAKRWTDTLNPAIDRSMWTPEADRILLKAVEEHGKVWTKIVKTYFPGRTGLSAKNRYNSITRYNSNEHSRGRARRSTPESPMEPMHRRLPTSSPVSSVTSSSSSPCNTPSPITPSIQLLGPAHFQPNVLDAFSGWQPSESTTMDSSFSDGIPLQINNPQNYAPPRPSAQPKSRTIDLTLRSLDSALNQTFSQYSHAPYQNGASHQDIFSHAPPQHSVYTHGSRELHQLYSQPAMTTPNQFASLGPYQADVDQFLSLAWESADVLPDMKQNDRLMAPIGGEPRPFMY